MAEAQLQQFLAKVQQLNAFVALCEASPALREALAGCGSHGEVVRLARSRGFEIGRRWGEADAPATADAVARILGNLGIEASSDDIQALLKELLINEQAGTQGPPAPAGYIRFSTFAVCMSRLRE